MNKKQYENLQAMCIALDILIIFAIISHGWKISENPLKFIDERWTCLEWKNETGFLIDKDFEGRDVLTNISVAIPKCIKEGLNCKEEPRTIYNTKPSGDTPKDWWANDKGLIFDNEGNPIIRTVCEQERNVI